jgi:hypothetical protein
MRRLALVLALVSTPAFAEPTSYMQGGVEFGGFDKYLGAGATIEVGGQVVPGLWLHAIATHGTADELFATGDGRYSQLRAGFDLRGCRHGGGLCSFVGVDVGVQHTNWTGVEDTWFGPDPNAMPVTYDRTRAIGVGRVGVDIGGDHFRWRPSLEWAFSNEGTNGFATLQSIAYRF